MLTPGTPRPSHPRRLRIVGVSGSGKSHLAAQAADLLDVAHLELDAVFWDAGWTHRDDDAALGIVRDFVDAHPDGWVADGNWTSKLGGLLDPGAPGGADALVWLDHSRSVVMRRLVVRTVRRAIRREELWHGNREKPSSWLRLDPEHNILRWAWVQHPKFRKAMLQRISRGDPVVRLAGQHQVDEWLASLR